MFVQSFHSRNGKAYLFNTVVNVASGPKEERMMTTGRHEVSDLHCTCCMQLVGWKYVRPKLSPYNLLLGLCFQVHVEVTFLLTWFWPPESYKNRVWYKSYSYLWQINAVHRTRLLLCQL